MAKKKTRDQISTPTKAQPAPEPLKPVVLSDNKSKPSLKKRLWQKLSQQVKLDPEAKQIKSKVMRYTFVHQAYKMLKDASTNPRVARLLWIPSFILIGLPAAMFLAHNPDQYMSLGEKRYFMRRKKFDCLEYYNKTILKAKCHHLLVTEAEYQSWEPYDFKVKTTVEQLQLNCTVFLNRQAKTKRYQGHWVIALHGLTENKWKMLRLVQHYLRSGFNVLIYDARAHGLSQGKTTTMGYHEKDDLNDLINYLKQHYPTKSIGLIGNSMGAVTIYEYLKKYYQKEPLIKWAVADSAFTTADECYRSAIVNFNLKVPEEWSYSAITRLNQWLNHYDINSIRPVDDLETIGDLPMLIVHGLRDRLVPAYMGKTLYYKKRQHESWTSRSKLLLSDGRHIETIYRKTKVYQRQSLALAKRSIKKWWQFWK